jgi:hypothetical protein
MRLLCTAARAAIPLVAALILSTIFAHSARAQNQPAPDSARVRVRWGGGEAARWTGRIRADAGTLENLKLLGLPPDSAGSIWLEDGAVHIASTSPHESNEIQVETVAHDQSRILIDLSRGAGAATSPIEVQLNTLRQRPFDVRLDDRGNVLHVELVPDDVLRIVTKREQMIFSPGEQFAFELQPQLPEMGPGTTLDIHTTLLPARSNETLWTDEQRLAVPVDGALTVALNVPLPKAEGVYRIRVSAARPPGFRPRFFPGAAAALAERTIDVVVLDSRPLASAIEDGWETVLEIDPTNARWWDRLPTWTQIRRIPGLSRGPLGSLRVEAVERPLGRFIELPPTIAGADPNWQAYSLPVEAVNTPHRLEIDYPADAEQQFGISIVEPNSSGMVQGIGRDAGVFVEGLGRGEAKELRTHQMVFWPRTQAPLLLVANQHPSAPAHFGRIRVLKRNSPGLAPTTVPYSSPERLVSAYIARPLLPETFGASEGFVPANFVTGETKTVDDWQTFYESSTRLSDYLRYAGFNAAVVNVMADGSSIYPASNFSPTPLYNSARAALQGDECDGLELLLRTFDRDRLALLPSLQFATPLPELEKLRRNTHPQTSGLEWIGPNGKTWVEVHGTAGGLAPYYNLLDPRVQQALLNVVRDLVTRYGDHSSFAGVSIQISANGYNQLAPLDWGLDDATTARFASDCKIKLPADGPNRFAARHAVVTGEHADVWRAWRTARVTEFYARLAAAVREGGNDRRLILTLEQSFSHPQVAARIRPNILLANRVDATLLDLGIDRQQLENVPGIAVSTTRYVEPMAPLPERAINLELNEAFAAWQKPANTTNQRAALIYHPPQRCRLPSFAAKSPYRVIGDAELVNQPLADGLAVRKPYVRTLLQHDASMILDGGELLPMGQEDVLRSVRAIVRQLPVDAEVSETSDQPVVTRCYAQPNGVTILVLNASPWQSQANITLDVPQAATMTTLGDHDSESSRTSRSLPAGQQSWSLPLEPYAIKAVRIDTPGVKVADISARVAESALAELKSQLDNLENRDLTAPRVYPLLNNPSFEPLGASKSPSGWQLTNTTASVELDAANPQEGKTSLFFRNTGGPVALQSDPFPMPPTGQLALTVHVREQSLKPGSELRIVVEALDDNHAYRRAAVIAPGNVAQKPAPDQWQYKAILVNDLPLESRGQMRLRFELTGPGEVWLDSVKLYDLLFPLKFYKFEAAENLQFVQLRHAVKYAYDEGRVADCVRQLERYWPRFLTEYTPLIQPVVNNAQPNANQALAPQQPNQAEQPAPGFGERLKGIFPFPR